MCYTLPTPEDPFNERKKRSKRKAALDGENNADEQSASRKRSRRTETGSDGKQKHSEGVNRTTSRAMDGNQFVNGMKDNKAGAKQTLGHRSGGKHAADVHALNLEQPYPGMLKNVHLKGSSQHVKQVVSMEKIERLLSGEKPTDSDVTDPVVLAFRVALSAIWEGTSAVVSDKNAGGDQEVGGQLRKDVSQFEWQWWQALAQGVDVLGASSNSYHARAYVVPAAAQIAAHRHTNGLLHKPIVLFLVCSREQALLVGDQTLLIVVKFFSTVRFKAL